MVKSAVEKVQKEFIEKVATVNSRADLDEVKIRFLGRKGEINKLLDTLKSLPPESRRKAGLVINELKVKIQAEITEKEKWLRDSNKKSSLPADPSLPGIKPNLGFLHPTTEIIRKINSFFRYYSYSVYEGPEIETNEYNFEKLNVPKDHPARDLQDTLYIKDPNWLLRTHPSSVETRAMVNEKLPIRIVAPGKVYRNETANATNNSMFYQYEGLVVDRNVTMANLKAILIQLVKFLYGNNTKTRFRCKYYPQVEPGAGLDINCFFCSGSGCQVCKYRGYIEVLGAGMVHPNVLLSCGID